MAKIRVLVIEDSVTVRRILVDVLNADPELEVVGEAADGEQGVQLCERLRPDVITLDMMMPTMTGLAVTEHVMAYRPTPILVVSASTNRGELFRLYDALAAGAVDAVEKPLGDDPAEWQKLVHAVKLVSRIKVITHPRARLGLGRTRSPTFASARAATCQVVAIGASTGGPAAMVHILRNLPSTFPLPILVVVHLGEAFGAAFADWLDSESGLPVRFAADGEPLAGAGVVLAPPGRHLVVRNGRLWLTLDPERHHCRPSVDELFLSLARDRGAECAACLLTGMGRDGAEGLLAIREAGGTTIAQDEATSVVFGMPREAVRINAASRVLPLDAIPGALCALAPAATRRGGVE